MNEQEIKMALERQFARELSHYDPVKAHEYYMAHRELKGRRSAAKLNDEGKEIWSATKDNITAEKKEKVEGEKSTRDKTIEDLRTKADETRARITEKLKRLNETLNAWSKTERARISGERDKNLAQVSEETKKQREDIANDRDAEIKRIQEEPIPEGLSKEKRAELAAEKREKIAKLRGDAKAKTNELASDASTQKSTIRSEAKSSTETVSETASRERAKNQSDASEQRKQVATELKTAIAAAREAYAAAKSGLDESYEDIYQREYDAILAEYAKSGKKSGKSASKKSSSSKSSSKKTSSSKKSDKETNAASAPATRKAVSTTKPSSGSSQKQASGWKDYWGKR